MAIMPTPMISFGHYTVGETVFQAFPERIKPCGTEMEHSPEEALWLSGGTSFEEYPKQEATITAISHVSLGHGRAMVAIVFSNLSREPKEGEDIKEIPYNWVAFENFDPEKPETTDWRKKPSLFGRGNNND